ncbi:hypothetical protein [Duganella sp. BuS-21]|uniref:hypothetical protein n=1 Tax=Duganella sp. BuS-21 TaxID=2943848 RepID=UPI0035A6470B
MSLAPSTYKRTIHPDFPHETILGTVAGVQPKVLVRRDDDGNYVTGGPTLADVLERFEVCDDLAEQLGIYALRKKRENPEWTTEFNIERTRKAIADKVDSGKWTVSADEQKWILDRVRESL